MPLLYKEEFFIVLHKGNMGCKCMKRIKNLQRGHLMAYYLLRAARNMAFMTHFRLFQHVVPKQQ